MIVSPYLETLQKHHQFQAQSNDCGPFCAAMILNTWYEQGIAGAKLANQMDRVHWKGLVPVIRRVPNWATFPWGVADVLRTAGLTVRWRIQQSISDIFTDLQNDQISIIIVGEFRPAWAHYKILAAHDPARGWGFVNPASRSGQLQWDTHATFLRQWGLYGRQVIRVTLHSR